MIAILAWQQVSEQKIFRGYETKTLFLLQFSRENENIHGYGYVINPP